MWIIKPMDDLAVGRLIMLVRQRKHWRQDDLASAAGVSRALVALAEAGGVERLTVRSLRKIAAPLEIRLPLAPLWNGRVTWLAPIRLTDEESVVG